MSIIWDLETMREVEKQYCDVAVPEETLDHPPEWRTAMYETFTDDYRRYVIEHTGVYVRHGIVSRMRAPDFTSWSHVQMVRFQWQPIMNTVRFLNGPFKNEVQALPKIGDPYKKVIRRTVSDQLQAYHHQGYASNTVTYEFYGWDDSVGQWVYILDPR